MTQSDYLRGARVVIVGAGVVGAVLSYRLAQAGASVIAVDRAAPGTGTTARSFGWLNGHDKEPREYHRLNILSIRDHEDLADELGGDWAHVTGSLHWAQASDPAQAARLAATVRRLLGWGMRVDRLTPAEAIELEPDLALEPATVQAVHLVHRAGWLDGMALAAAAIREARRRYAAELIRGEVVGLRLAGGMVESVHLSDGRTISADVVVNAVGPDANGVAALAGVRLPVERTPGLLVLTGPAPVALRRVAYGPDVHLRPDGGGRLMIQWEPLDSLAVEGAPLEPDDAQVMVAMSRARSVMPGLRDVEVEAIRLGVRCIPGDGYPVVGFDREVPNLYHAVTHSGITLAARLARLVTEELTNGDVEPLAAYRPSRFEPAVGAPRGLVASGE